MSELSELIAEHACLFASFDQGPDADFGGGSLTANVNAQVARHDPNAGRFGGAMVFDARDHGWAEDEFTFAAAGNFPYSASSFCGTISFWFHGDPDADLNDAYPVDPFHISRHPADGSFFIDFTRPSDERYGRPRKLRFGLYGDSPARDRFVGGQLLLVGELGLSDGQWHHVAAVWTGTNSGEENATAAIYLDGQLRGWQHGYRHDLTWDIHQLQIGLGQRYVGRLDELLILKTALTADHAHQLATLPHSAGQFLRT